MPPVIIAFTGYKGSGKDAVATRMHERLRQIDRRRYRGTQHNFATPVKQICGYMFNLEPEEMRIPALKEKVLDRWPHKSPRFLMQEFATNFVRAGYPDIWVRIWERTFDHKKISDYVFVSDLRFPNEYEMLRRRGAFIVKVERPDVARTDQHESEAYYDSFIPDVLLMNDSTIEELLVKVDSHLVPQVMEIINASSFT